MLDNCKIYYYVIWRSGIVWIKWARISALVNHHQHVRYTFIQVVIIISLTSIIYVYLNVYKSLIIRITWGSYYPVIWKVDIWRSVVIDWKLKLSFRLNSFFFLASLFCKIEFLAHFHGYISSHSIRKFPSTVARWILI